MVLALTLIDAPDAVVPGVAFFEIGVAGGQELLGELGVVREFVADALQHDVEFYLRPIGARGERFPGALGVGGSRLGGDAAAAGHVGCLGGLIGVLDIGVGQAFEFNLRGIEVGEETVGALEGVDFLGGVGVGLWCRRIGAGGHESQWNEKCIAPPHVQKYKPRRLKGT